MVPVKPPQICVIDDDQDHACALAEGLAAEGFGARVFASATAFLEACDDHCDCDLVITDLSMPGPSGLELCRLLRDQPCGRGRVPIILLSGSDPRLERARGLDAGADDFVAKPYEWRDLLAKVKSLLNIRAGELRSIERLKKTA